MFPSVLYPNRGRVTARGASALLVQQGVKADSDNCSVILPTRMAAGNLLVVCLMRGPESVVSSVNCDGHSLTKAVESAGLSTAVEIWFGESRESIDIIEIIGPGRLAANASEWSGLGEFALRDSSSHLGSDSRPVASAAPGSLVIACASWETDSYISGPTRGYARMDRVDNNHYLEAAYFIDNLVSSGTEWVLGTTEDWAVASATF